MFLFFSNRAGCLGSIGISIVLSAILILLMRSCNAGQSRQAVEARMAPESRPSFAEPAISPDGTEIAVVSGGDIWTVPVAGDARLLVAHAANESRPLYSPSGDRLAFVSDRGGDGDIYVLTLATGALQQITFDDGVERLDAWSRDGQ